MQRYTATQFRQNTKAILEASEKEPVIITRNGTPYILGLEKEVNRLMGNTETAIQELSTKLAEHDNYLRSLKTKQASATDWGA
jgi:PHD/YefM family antitoxin component YafN of YafNO toxin-antitoxin module